MRRLVVLLAVVMSLVFITIASAVPRTAAQDEGGGQTIRVWIEVYVMPYPPWTYSCRYGSDGYNTWQFSCWT